jgi:hypothetical protein
MLYENGKRSSFQNAVFLETLDDGQNPKHDSSKSIIAYEFSTSSRRQMNVHFYRICVFAVIWCLEVCTFSFFFISFSVCVIIASGVPGDTFVSMNRFSTLCGWLVQRQGWRVKGWIWPSERDRLGLTPDLTARDLWISRRWARGNENFVYSSLWDF